MRIAAVATLLSALSARSVAQVDECLADLDACLEGARVPEEVAPDIYMHDTIWHILVSNRESGERYFLEEIGLSLDGARTLSGYAQWAYAEKKRSDAAIQVQFCSQLEGVTSGGKLYESTLDWAPSRDRATYRIVSGVFAILSELDGSRVVEHAKVLRQTLINMRGDVPLEDYSTWPPERVARVIWVACAPDRY